MRMLSSVFNENYQTICDNSMNTSSTSRTEQKVSLIPILSVNFVGTLGFGIVLPFLIFLVTRFGGNAVIYGIMGATYSAFQLIGAPVLGRWSDKYGRRKILLLSQIGTLLSWIIFLIALYLPVNNLLQIDSQLIGTFTLTLPLLILFLSRALDGITGGNVSVANAYLADISDEDHRSANFGKMAVSANLGFIFGPALAGLLGATVLGETLPVLAALLISLAATLIIIIMLPESKTQLISKDPEVTSVRKIMGQEHKECYKIECKDKISIKDVLQLKNTTFLLAIYFLVFLGFNFFYIAFPVHAVRSLHWELSETGYFFSFLSIMMVLVQGPVLSRISKKWSDNILVVSGSLILAASFTFYLSHEVLIIYIGSALLALGNGIMWPSLLSLLSKSTSDKIQGTIQGYASSLGSAASIIGLLAGGLLYTQLGAGIFLISAAIIGIIFIMTLKLLGKGSRQ
jgi:DHA1 family tetracycline resistance protein-like MFS transporter